MKNKIDKNNYIVLNSKDNIGVLINDALSYDSDPIPQGHKIALSFIKQGDPIIKYGYVIGIATQDIFVHQHVHVHNMQYTEHTEHSNHEIALENKNIDHSQAKDFFSGYLRANGDVGLRNYIVVASTVNCSATVVKAICSKFKSMNLESLGIDGIVPVVHQSGCAQAIGGENYSILNKTLMGWINHPNVVGALIVGLGCEGTTFESIFSSGGAIRSDLIVKKVGIQASGGTSKTIELGCEKVQEILNEISVFKRTQQPVSKLLLALNCGGSDAFSSITANPLLGFVSDMIVQKGGMVALAEIPECHGTEGLLLSRAKDQRVQDKLKKTFSWWSKYAEAHNVSLNNNLAPGNIKGGITTIIEKSLGAVTKAGHTTLNDVVPYSEKIVTPGFNLMNTPGFDPVSVTGLVAGGCNMVAFTTGRGSTYGCAIAPTIKIATNHKLFLNMSDDMDFDASEVLKSNDYQQVSVSLFNFIIDVANGKKTCSEKLQMGWEEFVPWNLGETL